MKMDMRCLPCVVRQALRVSELVHAPDIEAIMRELFGYLAGLDYNKSAPEIMGHVFALLKRQTGNADPYRETRLRYDDMMLEMESSLNARVSAAAEPFMEAVKLAIAGNIIDFGPAHDLASEDVTRALADSMAHELAVDDTAELIRDISLARSLMYIGDNCGEICLDKLLIAQIRAINPDVDIVYGVRGAPIVNDALLEDAVRVGMDGIARVMDNGDDSQGTVLERVSGEFYRAYKAADVVIAKGQANFESLMEAGENIYFLMLVKCATMADISHAPERGMVCMKRR